MVAMQRDHVLEDTELTAMLHRNQLRTSSSTLPGSIDNMRGSNPKRHTSHFEQHCADNHPDATDDISFSLREPLHPFSDGSKHDAQNNSINTAKPIRRFWSSSTLARLAQNVAVTTVPLYFIVFAFLVHAYDGRPMDDAASRALVDAARYGPTIFPIAFAAIVGRLLKSTAASLLEKGSDVGTIETLLGGRTVSSAALLPFSLRFLHPLMPFLAFLWALSPLGGQAALRVVAPVPFVVNASSAISYLDVEHSPGIVEGVDNIDTYANVILSAFTAALSSPARSKNASQDLYGNLKIPLIESLETDQGPKADGWYTLDSETMFVYSSLAGIPYLGVPSMDRTSFNVETTYMYPNCSLNHDSSPDVFFTHAGTYYENITSSVITNGMYLAFDMDTAHHAKSVLPPAIGMWSQARDSDQWWLTNATCTLTTTYVEMQVVCEGTTCSTAAIRRSILPHLSSNLTALDGIYQQEGKLYEADSATQWKYFSLLINSTTQNVGNMHSHEPSPFEYYFVNPGSPYSFNTKLDAPRLYDIGATLFSQRLAQLMNTMWLDGAAPYALTGNFSLFLDGYEVLNATGTISRTISVLRCHKAWLAVLLLTSFVILFAGIGFTVLDALRRGPQVLDSFTGSLRENRYVRSPAHSSLEDGAAMAKRLRDLEVKLGDVEPEGQVGRTAVGTPTTENTVARLRKGRLYA